MTKIHNETGGKMPKIKYLTIRFKIRTRACDMTKICSSELEDMHAFLNQYFQMQLGTLDLDVLCSFKGHRNESEEIRMTLDSNDVKIAFVCFHDNDYQNHVEKLKILKEYGITTVMFGTKASLLKDHKYVLQLEGLADYFILGYPEVTALSMIQAFESGVTDFSTFNNVFYIKDGEIISNDFVSNFDQYTMQIVPPHPESGNHKWQTFSKFRYIRSSRGCPHRCNFCMYASFNRQFNPQLLYKSAGTLYKEVVDYVERGSNKIIFDDEDFLATEELHLRNLKFFGLMKNYMGATGKKVYFSFRTRVNRLWAIRDDLEKYRDGGVYDFCIGVENGSDEILKSFNKGLTVKQSYDTLEWLKQNKYPFGIFYICFQPEMTIQHMKENFQFLSDFFSRYYDFKWCNFLSQQQTFMFKKAILNEYNISHYDVAFDGTFDDFMEKRIRWKFHDVEAQAFFETYEDMIKPYQFLIDYSFDQRVCFKDESKMKRVYLTALEGALAMVEAYEKEGIDSARDVGKEYKLKFANGFGLEYMNQLLRKEDTIYVGYSRD